jgi:hypothetical protein
MYPQSETGWSNKSGFVPTKTDMARIVNHLEMINRQGIKFNPKKKATTSQIAYKKGVAETRLRSMAQLRSFAAGIQATNTTRGLQRSAPNETGYVDIAGASYANDTTGSITLLNTVAQGASVNQRIGKKFMMKSIQMRGKAVAGTAGTINTAVCYLIYDKRPTGALPAITDILVTATAASFNNDTNSGRFRTIRRWDKMILGGQTLATNPIVGGTENGGASALNLDEYVKLNLPVVNKAAGTGAIGDIEEGALYFVTVGDQPAGTAASSTQVGFRLRFTE